MSSSSQYCYWEFWCLSHFISLVRDFSFSLNAFSVFRCVPGPLCSLFLHSPCRALCGYFQSRDTASPGFSLISLTISSFHFLLSFFRTAISWCQTSWIASLNFLCLFFYFSSVALLRGIFLHLFVNAFPEHLKINVLFLGVNNICSC